MRKLFGKGVRTLYRKRQAGYGTILVTEVEENGELIHLLTVDDVRESAAFVEPGRHYDLVFPYTREFEKIFTVQPHLKTCLMLGGAGFSYPRSYISRHPECSMDVIEINPAMVTLAGKYFYLDELFREYDLEKNGRLSIIIDDADAYLRSSRRIYDAVINDAYIANRIDRSLLSPENTGRIKRSLSESGVYLINLITALTGELSMPRYMAVEILSRFFKNVTLYPVKPWLEPDLNQNCIIIASDGAIPGSLPTPHDPDNPR